MEARVVSKLSVVTKRDVFFLPVLVKGFVRTLIQVSLFDRNGSSTAQLTAVAVFILFFLHLFAFLVFLFRRRRSKQIRSPARFAKGYEEET